MGGKETHMGSAGMKKKEISKLFHISKQRINYWLHHKIKIKRKRKTKLTRNEKLMLAKWAIFKKASK